MKTFLICTLLASLLFACECRTRVKRAEFTHSHYSKDAADEVEQNTKNSVEKGLDRHEEVAKEKDVAVHQNGDKKAESKERVSEKSSDEHEHEHDALKKIHAADFSGEPISMYDSNKHHTSTNNAFGSPFLSDKKPSKYHSSNMWKTDKSNLKPAAVAIRPDMDIYFYDSISPPLMMHKSTAQYVNVPNLFESQSPSVAYKIKDDSPLQSPLSSSALYQQDGENSPDYYKWMQPGHRSAPIERAFEEIANMMVKVGLEDASDGFDYNSMPSHPFYNHANSFRSSPYPIVKLHGISSGSNNKMPTNKIDRSVEKSFFCPVHDLSAESYGIDVNPNDVGLGAVSSGSGVPQVVEVCSCRLMKKRREP